MMAVEVNMPFDKLANMNRAVTVARNFGIGQAAPTNRRTTPDASEPVAVLQNRVRAAFTAAQRFSDAVGSRRLGASESRDWERLTADIKTAKAALAAAQADAARPSAAAAAMHGALAEMRSKPARETAAGGMARGVGRAIASAHAKRGAR